MRAESMQKIDRYKNIVFLVGLACIYLLSWLMQTNTFVSGDISWGLHEATRLLNGGSYGKDFFEVNPPLFLYLYTPPIILAKFLPLTLFTIFQLYVFLLASLSLGCCYGLLKNLLPIKQLYYFISMLAFVLVLLPLATAFGERDHLMMIFIMPYLLLIGCRLQNHPAKTSFTIFIGLIAGIGFAIKPFFYCTLVLVELYYLCCQRSWLAWLRAETLAITIVLAIYILAVWLFCPAYITFVLPLAARLYYQGYSTTWDAVLLDPTFLFCGLTILLYLALYQINSYKKFSTVLLIAMCGLCLSYAIQRTVWYYHIYPAFGLTILLDVYFFSLFVAQKREGKILYLQMIFIGLLSLALINKYQSPLQGSVLSVLTLFCILAIGVIFSCAKKNKLHFTSSAVISALALSLPLSCVTINLVDWLSYQEKSAELIAFMQLHARHQPVYFLSNTLRIEFPLVDYAEAIPASQYPTLWWFSGYTRQTHAVISEPLRVQLEKDRDYFLDMIASELTTNKPELVFVEAGDMAPVIDGHTFDYVDNFSQNAHFQAAWKNYRYLTTLSKPTFYHYQVYQRIKGTTT